MKGSKQIFFTLIISVFSFVNFAQITDFGDLSKYSFREKFETANSLMLVDLQYDRALPIWKNLIEEQPENLNLNYKLGYCILYSSINRDKSLPYLEKASKGISNNYSHFDFDEKNVPNEVLFHLGKAYHLNYQMDKAKETFNTFKSNISKKHILINAVELELVQCDVAKIEVARKKNYIIKNVGSVINGPYSDYGPVVTADDNLMFFTSRRLRSDSANVDYISPQDGKYFEDVYLTHRDPNTKEWTEPEIINAISNPRSNQATISSSFDGKLLFVYVDDEGDGNIYVSEYNEETGEYERLTKLEDKINTPSWETHATINRDGTVLYFVSDKDGGFGGRDIYKVTKNADGTWSDAVNLGETINTKNDEDSPFFHPDDQTLFYSSNGPSSMGGFDIFFTYLNADGSWTNPRNIGYPLNTVDDDIFLVTNPSSKKGYYSSSMEGGYGEKDIYEVLLDTSYAKEIALLKGHIVDTIPPYDSKVVVTNVTKKKAPETYYPRKIDGGFIVILDPCNDYLIEYFTNDSLFFSEDIKVPCDTSYYELERTFDLNKTMSNNNEFATVIDSAAYQKFFGYNKTNISSDEDNFMKFITDSKHMLSPDKMLFITIEGSASWVPTRTFGNNHVLAKKRAEDAKKIITTELEKQGINLNFVTIETTSKAQGPKYEGDFKDTEKYGPFQYVKAKATIKSK